MQETAERRPCRSDHGLRRLGGNVTPRAWHSGAAVCFYALCLPLMTRAQSGLCVTFASRVVIQMVKLKEHAKLGKELLVVIPQKRQKAKSVRWNSQGQSTMGNDAVWVLNSCRCWEKVVF